MLSDDELRRLRNIMDNFVQLQGPHPEERLERIERKLERVSEDLNVVKMGLSNAQLVQRGVLWLGGIIGSSAIAMLTTLILGGSPQ